MSDIINSIKDTKEFVLSLLLRYPNLRDNDNKLIATYHLYEIGGKEKFQTISGYEYSKMVIDGKLTNPSNISRARRKLQETVPETRGEQYEKRKLKAKEVRNKIKDL